MKLWPVSPGPEGILTYYTFSDQSTFFDPSNPLQKGFWPTSPAPEGFLNLLTKEFWPILSSPWGILTNLAKSQTNSDQSACSRINSDQYDPVPKEFWPISPTP